MHATVLRRVSSVSSAISRLLPQKVPPSISRSNDLTLFQLLARAPTDLKGTVVHQQRWSQKGRTNWFWKITDARFKGEGKHGKVWGIFYLNGWSTSFLDATFQLSMKSGRKISEKPELIQHALKYTWAEGRSGSIATSRKPTRTSKTKGKLESAPESKVNPNIKAGT